MRNVDRVLGIGLILAGMLGEFRPQPALAPAPDQLVDVLVARHWLGAPYVITPDDVEVRQIPLTDLNPAALRSFKRGRIDNGAVPPGGQIVIRP